jgi:hypothetical protein
MVKGLDQAAENVVPRLTQASFVDEREASDGQGD